MEANAREAKEQKISRNRFARTFREKWIGFILPGVHLLHRGSGFFGMVLFSLVFLGLYLLGLGDPLLKAPHSPYAFVEFPFHIFGVFFALVGYFTSLLSAIGK
jgi:hypothetical protein